MKLSHLIPILSATTLASAFPSPTPDKSLSEFQNSCSNLVSKLNKLSIPSTTVFFSQFISAGTNVSIPDRNTTCGSPFQVISSDVCRVALYVATSERSGIHLEALLPRNWEGRFLSTGNGGLAGCIGYDAMDYAAGLGFAAVGANNGHNGTSGGAFYNNPEVVADFSYRSVHTGVVVGKQITKTFYRKPHKKSYYLGCSTGGRQGFKEAQDFPEDFDGLSIGAPALAMNNLTSWLGSFYNKTGPPDYPTFVPRNMWPVIHRDILAQCDKLDGYADGILEDPDLCNYTSKGLVCGTSSNSSCLTPLQSQTVDKIFSPLLGLDGSLVYPRMQPGSEIIASAALYTTGAPHPYTVDWMRYAVYNDPNWDATTINATDYANAARINPGNIETWNGNLNPLRKRGAKILHWHGLMDGIISSENSARYYKHVAQTMNVSPKQLDSFYRYFRISGLAHCSGGDGAWNIGQGFGSGPASLDPKKNVLMALVKWVEEGDAPETITGTKFVGNDVTKGIDFERSHCRYPRRNVYCGKGDPKKADSWDCV